MTARTYRQGQFHRAVWHFGVPARVPAYAYLCEPFAILREGRAWALYHVQSGCQLPGAWTTLSSAKAAADRVADLPIWGFTLDQAIRAQGQLCPREVFDLLRGVSSPLSAPEGQEQNP